MFCLVEKKNITDNKYDIIGNYILYENNKYYYLPRYAKKYLKYDQIKFYKDQNFIYDKIIPFHFNSQLLPRQRKILNQLRNTLNKQKINGIIHARPGFGKTVFGIYLINLLQYKTIVFVDSEMLYNQWMADIFKHTTLTRDRIGLIKGDIFDVENKDVIFTTPQTMSSKFKREDKRKEYYKKIKSLGINLLLQDESHIISNKQASSFLFFDTENIVGFTATPYFSGKQKLFMKMLFDNVIAKYNEYKFNPEVVFVNYKSNIKDNKQIRRLYATYNNVYVMFLQIYNSLLYKDFGQYEKIINICKYELNENDNNKIIIIVSTIKQMNKLYDLMKKHNINNITKLYAGDRKIDKRKDRVIIAVYKYASKAFDNKYLNRAIIPIPISGRKSLTQTIGRILRDSDDKKDARVYIFNDDNKKLKSIFSKIKNIQIYSLKSEFKNLVISSN